MVAAGEADEDDLHSDTTYVPRVQSQLQVRGGVSVYCGTAPGPLPGL